MMVLLSYWAPILIPLELYAILWIELVSRAPELPWHD